MFVYLKGVEYFLKSWNCCKVYSK